MEYWSPSVPDWRTCKRGLPGQQPVLRSGDQLGEVRSGGAELFDLLLHGGQNLRRTTETERLKHKEKKKKLLRNSSAPTWKRERTDGWNTRLVLSRKARRRGCGKAASWARMPVSSRLT